MSRRYLIVAEMGRNNGAGHLMRCSHLAENLVGTVAWKRDAGDSISTEQVAEICGKPPERFTWVDDETAGYDVILVDRRRMDVDEACRLRRFGCTVALDAAEPGRRYHHYCIDALPSLSRHGPNVASTSYLPLPETVRSAWPNRTERVLVAIGGADGGRFSLSTAHEVARALPPHHRKKLRFYAAGSTIEPDGTVDVLSAPGTLREHLAEFDLVITHFGLTAYEASWARVPVVLLDTSRYHRALAERAGFPRFPSTAGIARVIAASLEDNSPVVCSGTAVRPAERGSLSSEIDALVLPEEPEGPVGDLSRSPVLFRMPGRSFFRLSSGMVAMLPFGPVPTAYDHEYFFSEYRSQYGRTYIEDIPSIAEVGARRLRDIRRARKRRGREIGDVSLLDIGCAFGAFLLAVSRCGWKGHGCDVSREAVEYTASEFGVPTTHLDIMGASEEDLERLGEFDVVTLWYVIEHVPRLDPLLERIRGLVKPGGTLAISTPNMAGVSGRRNLSRFLGKGPADHFTIWSPRSARRVLSATGFRVLGVRSTGHHPERFALGGLTRNRLLHGVLHVWSRIARRGDTFEIIAERL